MMNKEEQRNEEFKKFQRDWHKQVTKFLHRGYKMNLEAAKEDGHDVFGMTEVLMFGIFWTIVTQAMQQMGPQQAELEEQFLTNMFVKLMKGEGPQQVHYQDEDGNDLGPISNKKPTIN
jgi:hypothetical protein